ncbi:MAG: acyl-CoA dehydrogenase family protein, partial [Gammaproteobacteria bacterium]|nr:acyl-CoA dehydrogenase family protein [Gammaproteobacteria bacterium]
MQVARELAPEIAAAAAETEAGGELPHELAARIADAGLFRLLVPRSLGGDELDQPTYVRVIEELARADASTAWCVNQCAVFATNAAFLARDVAESIWAEPRAVVA